MPPLRNRRPIRPSRQGRHPRTRSERARRDNRLQEPREQRQWGRNYYHNEVIRDIRRSTAPLTRAQAARVIAQPLSQDNSELREQQHRAHQLALHNLYLWQLADQQGLGDYPEHIQLEQPLPPQHLQGIPSARDSENTVLQIIEDIDNQDIAEQQDPYYTSPEPSVTSSQSEDEAPLW